MISLLFLVLSSVAQADTTVKQRLLNHGFSCVDQSQGTICTIPKVTALRFQYDQPIAVFVPAALEKPKSLLLHLHGHKGVCEAPDAPPRVMVNNARLLDQLLAAGRTETVAIFPMSRPKNSTYETSLVPSFPRFKTWIHNILKPEKDKWILSGHSAAGKTISQLILKHPSFAKKVESIYLLDATQNMERVGKKWKEALKANPKMHIYSSTLSNDATKGALRLRKILRAKVETMVSKTQDQCRVPSLELERLLKKSAEQKPIARMRTLEEAVEDLQEASLQ